MAAELSESDLKNCNELFDETMKILNIDFSEFGFENDIDNIIKDRSELFSKAIKVISIDCSDSEKAKILAGVIVRLTCLEVLRHLGEE